MATKIKKSGKGGGVPYNDLSVPGACVLGPGCVVMIYILHDMGKCGSDSRDHAFMNLFNMIYI